MNQQERNIINEQDTSESYMGLVVFPILLILASMIIWASF